MLGDKMHDHKGMKVLNAKARNEGEDQKSWMKQLK